MDVIMTNWGVGFNAMFEQDISYRMSTQEHKLSFKMSEYYGFCRKWWYEKFYISFYIWWCLGFLNGFIITIIPLKVYEFGVASPLGSTDGMF
mmetsp:Transcript_7802/g.7262  ORF Transcript_7802/g.7262 Transcript_7802/m.7262 type:complete len:92 (+) Transcript_7802:964-1239(+)